MRKRINTKQYINRHDIRTDAAPFSIRTYYDKDTKQKCTELYNSIWKDIKFPRHYEAYLSQRVDDKVKDNVYLETFGNTENITATKSVVTLYDALNSSDDFTVVENNRPSKTNDMTQEEYNSLLKAYNYPVYHKPALFIIEAARITDDVINRARFILQYANKLHIISDELHIKLYSEYTLNNGLNDLILFSLNGGPRQKQSPFNIKSERLAMGLLAYQNIYANFVDSYVSDLLSVLYEEKTAYWRERRYELSARTVYRRNKKGDYWISVTSTDPKADPATTWYKCDTHPVRALNTQHKARAFGFDIQLDETLPTIDDYVPVEDAYDEDADIWDTPDSAEKGLVTRRQKSKISQLPSSPEQIKLYDMALNWFKNNGGELTGLLDPEDTFCTCGHVVNIHHEECYNCGKVNENFVGVFTHKFMPDGSIYKVQETNRVLPKATKEKGSYMGPDELQRLSYTLAWVLNKLK